MFSDAPVRESKSCHIALSGRAIGLIRLIREVDSRGFAPFYPSSILGANLGMFATMFGRRRFRAIMDAWSCGETVREKKEKERRTAGTWGRMRDSRHVGVDT